MGQYVIVEHEKKFRFNLCANDGHILVSSLIFSSREDCERGIKELKEHAKSAAIEDSTECAFCSIKAPKYRIYQDMEGNYFFAFITKDGGDLAKSHSYPKKESLMRRIDKMRFESASSVAAMDE